MNTYFVTGTDTDCGKTYVTCQLLNYLNKRQKRAFALKPIVSGCFEKNGQLQNDDLLNLQKHNRIEGYAINKWQFVSPISPHLAAKEENTSIQIPDIAAFCTEQSKLLPNLDYLLIEGAGGLLVPLNDEETWLDFLILTQIPVIVVVGMRLGCLNHALLTDAVLKNNSIRCAGWIANCLDNEMLALAENIETLTLKMHKPLLAVLPYQGELKDELLV